MKKVIALLLASVILLTMTACGGSGESTAPSENGSVMQNTAAPSQGADNIPETSPAQSTEGIGIFNSGASITETVMYEENGVKITATGLDYSDYSVELKLTIENNSVKDLSIISGSAGYSCNSINGCMIDGGYLNCGVAAGKKANDSIEFSYDSLMLYGINEIADMEIGFDISDAEYNHTYSGPKQITTTAYDGYDYSKNHYQDTITSAAAMNTYGYEMVHFSREPLYDVNGIKLLSSGMMTNRNGDPVLLLELENTTSNMVNLSTTDITINGLVVCSSTWSNDSINAGKRCVVGVNLSSVFDAEYWEVYGIDEIRSIKLSLIQRDEDGTALTDAAAIEVIIPGTTGGYSTEGTEVYSSNGLRIVAKTILEDPSEYSGDMYVLLLTENNSGATVTIQDVYDSLSVNGYMTDYSYYSKEIANGESAVLEIKLWGSDLEDNNIAAVSDIAEVEISFEIKEGHNTIDEPMIKIIFGEAAADSANTSETAADELRPEFKAAMDAYEAFYDEYVDFMVKFKADPTNAALLLEYEDLLIELGKMDASFKEWESNSLNSEEMKYYLDASNRIMKKLVEITG